MNSSEDRHQSRAQPRLPRNREAHHERPHPPAQPLRDASDRRAAGPLPCETILSSSTTACLVEAIGQGRSDSFIAPEGDPADGQFFAQGVDAGVLHDVLLDAGHNIGEQLAALLSVAEAHGFELYVDHRFSNRDGGAIGRVIENDEW